MGTLRNTLKVIFNEQNVEDVIKMLTENGDPANFAIANIDKGFYTSAYNKLCPEFTEDQAVSAFRISERNWNQPREPKDNSFTYCRDKNIFNTLLHFSTQVLIERNQEPICKFEDLLKWHEVTYLLGEDIFTISYFASKDIKSGLERKSFSWPVVIDHDSSMLHELYKHKMADIHNHLGGNGYVPELNWLSLMNDVMLRRGQFNDKKFKISKALHTFYGMENEYTSLYAKVMKAAALRLYLFDVAIAEDDRESQNLIDWKLLCRLLKETSSVGVDMYISEISTSIAAAQRVYGKCYETRSKESVYVDYALLQRADYQLNNPYRNINFVLSGERWLLYRIFRKIYGGEDKDNRVSMMFYIYLLIKNEFQNELVQSNSFVGFGNFKDYQDRKSAFLKKNTVYNTLLTQTSIKSLIDDKRDRYVETRIAPDRSNTELEQSIQYYDNSAVYINADNNKFLTVPKVETNQWHYVTHFLKKEDKYRLDGPLQNPRNWNVRREVRMQSQAIDTLRQYNTETSKRIVGIDAASSELCCRPEVFAQGFRFLRNSMYSSTVAKQPLKELGVTYHVGEDFNDVIDGLRAVKEAVLFLEMRNGDRIGHGLVLGTDVQKYYDSRDRAVPMSKQCILDNMAFLIVEGATIEGFCHIGTKAKQHYERLLLEIYGEKLNGVMVSPYTYYQSWLLRGDNPELYVDCTLHQKDTQRMANALNGLPWQRCSMAQGEVFDIARNNKYACYLYHLYHYNNEVKKRGNEYEQLEYPPEAIGVIAGLQEKILTEIETRCISIECNPTSNYKIGEIERYIEHPISMFNMIKRPEQGQMHCMSVSINTDDKGVFSTSLEREFALIAAAYDKEFKHNPGNSPAPREVYDWLNVIREMALEMAFAKADREINAEGTN